MTNGCARAVGAAVRCCRLCRSVFGLNGRGGDGQGGGGREEGNIIEL